MVAFGQHFPRVNRGDHLFLKLLCPNCEAKPVQKVGRLLPQNAPVLNKLNRSGCQKTPWPGKPIMDVLPGHRNGFSSCRAGRESLAGTSANEGFSLIAAHGLLIISFDLLIRSQKQTGSCNPRRSVRCKSGELSHRPYQKYIREMPPSASTMISFPFLEKTSLTHSSPPTRCL